MSEWTVVHIFAHGVLRADVHSVAVIFFSIRGLNI